jgi:4-alpha-glucanotransferase
VEPDFHDTEDSALPWPERYSGVLLHPTSLPGPFGVGDLGPEANRFIDFLTQAGQCRWQIMPLGPPGPGNSPYAARSTFAGDPALISPERLRDEGLLEQHQFEDRPSFDAIRIDFEAVHHWKDALLRAACERFLSVGREPELQEFTRREQSWLPDYALFMALRTRDRRAWSEWAEPLASREPEALQQARSDLAPEIRFHEFVQWAFFRQWHALKQYANSRNITIIGDLPIFVDYDSADVWAHQDLFHLDEHGRQTVVAGVPPDVFSATGQHWGNPMYRWEAFRRTGYRWWIDRLKHTLAMVDIVRLDHFRGFVAAWEIPAADPTAQSGRWVAGPGRELFDAAAAEIGHLGILVEDLGLITERVRNLRDELGYPGMKILQFAFGDDSRNPYLPHNIPANAVVYTGTHDNDTTAGWYASLPQWQRDSVLRYLARDGHDIVSDLIRLALASVAETAIIPMQDILGLGSEARMNVPGQPEGNWGWRFHWDQLDPGRTAWLRQMSLTYGRCPAS